jgi:gamma-glutamyltranspeptidase / glutathione hydrolase
MPSDAFVIPRSVSPPERPFGVARPFEDARLSGLSVGVPGTLATWEAALDRFGTESLRDMLEPSILLATKGFTVDQTFRQQTLDNQARFEAFPDTAELFLPNGEAPKVGSIFKNHDLAMTLRQIQLGGTDVFYDGPIAEEIAEVVQDPITAPDATIPAFPGSMTADDIADYEVIERDPTHIEYRGLDVYGMAPSSSGGTTVGESLNILENFDLSAMEHNSTEYLRIVSEAMKRATIDKDAHVGDPKFVDVPVERLTSKSYAKTMAGEIMRGVKAEVPRFNSGAVSKDTTHISVLDKDGNCFTMTHSLGMPSGVVTPGLGFMYNGCMGVFDPRPDRAGSIAPGKARFSSVVPSIIFKDGQPHLIIGAPGATQIAMGVLHAVLNALDFDMTMVEAVSAPRFSATSDTIDISNRIQFKVERELQAIGYNVVRSPYTFGFAAVHGIRVHEDGLDGGADPGHDGVVIAT